MGLRPLYSFLISLCIYLLESYKISLIVSPVLGDLIDFFLNGYIGATECWSGATCVIGDDGHDSSVESWAKQKQATHHNEDVKDSHDGSAGAGK